MPSFDVCGKTVDVSFWQYEPAMVGKVGAMVLAMVMFIDAVVEQLSEAEGVNLYVVVPSTVVLMVAGFHVPVMPSFEAGGSVGGKEF